MIEQCGLWHYASFRYVWYEMEKYKIEYKKFSSSAAGGDGAAKLTAFAAGTAADANLTTLAAGASNLTTFATCAADAANMTELRLSVVN